MIRVVETFIKDPLANEFLVINNDIAVVVDPCSEPVAIEKRLKGAKLQAVLLTHGHRDHWETLDKVVEYFKVPCYLAKSAKEKLGNDKLSLSYYFEDSDYWTSKLAEKELIYLADKQKIAFDDTEIIAMHLPGHTDCSFGFLLSGMLFCGDALFEDSIGRVDTPTGSPGEYLETLERLKGMDESIVCYSGHGASFTIANFHKNYRVYQRYLAMLKNRALCDFNK